MREDGKNTARDFMTIWLNKRALTSIDMLFRNDLTNAGDGWRIDAREAGELRVRFAGGVEKTIAVDAGDHIQSSGEDLYVALQRSRREEGCEDAPR